MTLRRTPARGTPPGRHRGFTLLEMLAVLLLIGLIASLVLPNLGALSEQALRSEAQRLQAELERTRERALVTGIRHQLVIDLGGSLSGVETPGLIGIDRRDLVPGLAFRHLTGRWWTFTCPF